MAWIKFDDGFSEHDKVAGLSPRALRLLINAFGYAARNETDGHIPAHQLRALSGSASLAAELVAAIGNRKPRRKHGLWERRHDGFAIHDYLEYNPSHEELEAKRAGSRERVAKSRNGTPHVRANVERTE